MHNMQIQFQPPAQVTIQFSDLLLYTQPHKLYKSALSYCWRLLGLYCRFIHLVKFNLIYRYIGIFGIWFSDLCSPNCPLKLKSTKNFCFLPSPVHFPSFGWGANSSAASTDHSSLGSPVPASKTPPPPPGTPKFPRCVHTTPTLASSELPVLAESANRTSWSALWLKMASCSTPESAKLRARQMKF